MENETVVVSKECADFVGTLFEEHKKNIFSYIYFKLKDRDISNDILSEVYVKALVAVSTGKYKSVGKDFPWLLMIARNLVVDHFRKAKKSKTVRESKEFGLGNIVDDSQFSWYDKQRNFEIGEDLAKIINLLPKEQRVIVEMRIRHGLKFREIAKELDVNMNTVLGRMRYALINLRRIIKDKDLDLDGFRT
jgi:RNA polymerase sigma-70 factor (ECF subfamily)